MYPSRTGPRSNPGPLLFLWIRVRIVSFHRFEYTSERTKAIRGTTKRGVKSVCDAWQSFSMEASVRLPCDVLQKWSGSEPWR
jgi:hypothetical protein